MSAWRRVKIARVRKKYRQGFMKRNPLAYPDHCWFWKEPWVILIAVAIVIIISIVRTIVVLVASNNDGSNNCSKNSRNKNNTDNHNASAASTPGCKSPKRQTPKFKSKKPRIGTARRLLLTSHPFHDITYSPFSIE